MSIAWLRPSRWDGGPASLAEHVRAITAAMDGTGDRELPTRLWLGPFDPPETLPPSLTDAVLVVPTSGSTGTAKAVALSREALLASQDATARALASAAGDQEPMHGHWLPLLPPTHIAGIQVIARAVRTAQVHGLHEPALPEPLPDLSGHFDARAFRRVAEQSLELAASAGLPALTSLVPTQLSRILEDPAASRLLSRFAAVLVGGAATLPALRRAALEAGIAIRTTYGSSETAGGCVYDRVPLPGVDLRLLEVQDGAGRLEIRSPTLALGYLRADGTATRADAFRMTGDGVRSFLTSDLARLDGGLLSILGRADDVIITGGRKVLPQDVERAALSSPLLDGVLRAIVVVGVEDLEWGQRIEALVVLSPGAAGVDLRPALREAGIPGHALPKAVHVVDGLPQLGIGKIDRAAARSIASDAA